MQDGELSEEFNGNFLDGVVSMIWWNIFVEFPFRRPFIKGI